MLYSLLYTIFVMYIMYMKLLKFYLVVIPKFNYRYLGKVFVVQIYLKFNC